MARKPGQKLDPALVEQAKALKRLKHTDKAIAKQMGLAVSTVRRYIEREDETPAVVAARDAEYEKFVVSAWGVLHDFMTILKESARDKDGNLRRDISPRDAAWVSGVIYDKIASQDARANPKPTNVDKMLNIQFIVEGDGKSISETISNPGEVPFVGRQVSSDGVRPGGGENVLRLPGSSDNVIGDT